MRCKLTILAQSSKASSRSQDLSVRFLSSLRVEALSGFVGNTKIATKNIHKLISGYGIAVYFIITLWILFWRVGLPTSLWPELSVGRLPGNRRIR